MKHPTNVLVLGRDHYLTTWRTRKDAYIMAYQWREAGKKRVAVHKFVDVDTLEAKLMEIINHEKRLENDIKQYIQEIKEYQ